MTIQITKPEVEALINQRLESGRFHDVDELLAKALDALQAQEHAADASSPPRGKSHIEVFQRVRGLADDVDFSRNSSTARPLDL